MMKTCYRKWLSIIAILGIGSVICLGCDKPVISNQSMLSADSSLSEVLMSLESGSGSETSDSSIENSSVNGSSDHSLIQSFASSVSNPSSSSSSSTADGIVKVVPPTKFTPNPQPEMGAGVPKRLPTTLGNMTMNNLMYKPKQYTGIIDLVDLRVVDGGARMAALALQGLVARNDSARVFFITSEYDLFWKNQVEIQHKVKFQELTLNEFYEKYAKFVKKIIVYDWPTEAEDPYQLNIAFNLAAISDGLPLSTGLAEFVLELGWYPKNIPIQDITDMWDNKTEAYEWALVNVMPKCNKNYVGVCDSNDTIWDYMYATKSFTYWLNNRVSSELTLIHKILTTPGYTMPGIVFGYGPTGDEMLLASGPKGFSYLVSDYFANATYLSSIPPYKKVYKQNPIKDLTAQNGKIYFSLFLSDGDNIQFNQKLSQQMWAAKGSRGKYPIAIELNAALYEISPTMMEWYYSQLTPNDEFMGGPSGFSYLWEDEFKLSAFDGWHAINNYFINKFDMRVVCTARVPNSNSINKFMQKFDGLGSMDWGDPFESDKAFTGNVYLFDSKPIIVSTNTGTEVFNRFASITVDPTRPTFYSICTTQAYYGEDGYDVMNGELDKLKNKYGDDIVFLLPSDLLTMAKKWKDAN